MRDCGRVAGVDWGRAVREGGRFADVGGFALGEWDGLHAAVVQIAQSAATRCVRARGSAPRILAICLSGSRTPVGS